MFLNGFLENIKFGKFYEQREKGGRGREEIAPYIRIFMKVYMFYQRRMVKEIRLILIRWQLVHSNKKADNRTRRENRERKCGERI